MSRLIHATMVMLLLFVLPVSQAGAKKRSARPFARTPEDLVIDALASSDDAKAVAAAKELGHRKTESSYDALLQQLMLGPSFPVAKAMLEAVIGRISPKAKQVLLYYFHHRRRKLRTLALEGLAKLVEKWKDSEALAVLMKALRDYDGSVRAQASWLLGKIAPSLSPRQRHDAEAILLRLLAKGDKGALLGLGRVGGVRAAMAVSLELKKGRFSKEDLVSCLSEMLMNPNFGPEPVRMQLVDNLASSNVPGATDALLKYAATGPVKFKKSRAYAQEKLSK